MKKNKKIITLVLSFTLLFSTSLPLYASPKSISDTYINNSEEVQDIGFEEIKSYAIKNNKVMPPDVFEEFERNLQTANTPKAIDNIYNRYEEYIISGDDLGRVPSRQVTLRSTLGDVRTSDDYVYTNQIKYHNISGNDIPTFSKLTLNIASSFLTTGRSIIAALLGSIPTGEAATKYKDFLSYTEHDKAMTIRLGQIYVPQNIFYENKWVNYVQSSRTDTKATVTTKYGYNGRIITQRTSSQLVERQEGYNFTNPIWINNKAKALYKEDVNKYGNANTVVGPRLIDNLKSLQKYNMKLDFKVYS